VIVAKNVGLKMRSVGVRRNSGERSDEYAHESNGGSINLAISLVRRRTWKCLHREEDRMELSKTAAGAVICRRTGATCRKSPRARNVEVGVVVEKLRAEI
jgi:hypothetical protein